MQLKFSLLDEDDLKSLETTLVRAMVRAFRQLAKEGLFAQPTVAPAQPEPRAARPLPPTSGWPVTPAFPPEPPPIAPPPASEEPVPVDLESLDEVPEERVEVGNGAAAPTEGAPPQERPVPVFLRPPPASSLPPGRAREPVSAQPKKRAKHRSAQQVCKTVADRPHGYIQTTEAYELMGGSAPSGQLSQYVHNREVEAVIVAGIKPPTKGLPGRLMINKASLMTRLKLRDENKAKPVRERMQTSSITSPG